MNTKIPEFITREGAMPSELEAIRSNQEYLELLSIDGRDNMSECASLYINLKSNFSETSLRGVLCEDWAHLSEMARINICFAAYNAKAMSVETALELFLHPSSDTHERHLIVAGLAVSEHQRHLGEPLYVLAAHIGKYDNNPNRQRSLEKFLHSVERLRKQNACS